MEVYVISLAPCTTGEFCYKGEKRLLVSPTLCQHFHVFETTLKSTSNELLQGPVQKGFYDDDLNLPANLAWMFFTSYYIYILLHLTYTSIRNSIAPDTLRHQFNECRKEVFDLLLKSDKAVCFSAHAVWTEAGAVLRPYSPWKMNRISVG